MLIIKNLHKSYGNKDVLKGLNLNFASGQITGVVGKNGAGKTTLFRCIAGLETYLGQVGSSSGAVNEIIGFLDTNPYYLPKLTGQEYLQLLCNGRSLPLPVLDEVNLFDLPLNEYAATYSTGMRKKLALTGVLLQKNEIFIFDEPFNGVDIESNILMKTVFRKLKSLNKVILISSHVFPVLEEICDKLYYLEEGEINQTAEKAEDFYKIEKQMEGQGFAEKANKILGI